MRRLWIAAGSLLTVVALTFGTAQAVDLLAREVVTETASFPAGGVATVDVRTVNGRVEVSGADVDRVEITASVRQGAWRTRNLMTVDGDRIVVRASCPPMGLWCGADYRIVVPRQMALQVRTSNARTVLRDLDGTVRAHGDNGSIEAYGLTGETRLETDNGDVVAVDLGGSAVWARSDNGSVRLAFAVPPRDVTAETDNGDVDVTLPDTTHAYRVAAETDNGDTDIAVRTDPRGERTVTATTDNGDVRVRYPD